MFFGVCGKHVSSKVDLNGLITSKHPELGQKLLLESDSLSLETWEGEMIAGRDMVDVDWARNWAVCADLLEREREEANRS